MTSAMSASKKKQQPSTDEPVGIVISSGPTEPESPRFSAYVWGPAPQSTKSSPSKAA